MQSQPVFNCVCHLHHIHSQAVFIISLGPAVLFWIYFNKPGTPRPVIFSDVDRACKTLYAPSSMLKARAAVSCRSAADGGFVCTYQITSHSSRIRTLKSYVVMTSQQYAASTKSRGCGPDLMPCVHGRNELSHVISSRIFEISINSRRAFAVAKRFASEIRQERLEESIDELQLWLNRHTLFNSCTFPARVGGPVFWKLSRAG